MTGPPPNPDVPPTTAGGQGWSVRPSTPTQSQPAGELAPPELAAPPPPPPPPAVLAPASASGVPAGRPRRMARWVVVTAGLLAVLVCGGVTVYALSARSPSGAAAAPATTTPPTTASTPTLNPAVVAQAGQQYLAAVTPLNSAENGFHTALVKAMSQPCSCPAGEFNATSAVVLIPGIDTDLQTLQATLRKIQTELPSFSSETDSVAGWTQQELTDFAGAYQASQQGDMTGFANKLNAVGSDQASVATAITKLRADLELPPPAA